MSDSGKELTATLYSLVHSLERFGPVPGWSNVPSDGSTSSLNGVRRSRSTVNPSTAFSVSARIALMAS